MKTRIAVQDEEALDQKQDDPAEHGKAMNDDQRNDLPGNFASTNTLSVEKKEAESHEGRDQHHHPGENIKEALSLQGSQGSALRLRPSDCL